MRKSLFFAVFTIILSMAGLAQNGKISYQAVVRNSANQLVYDQDLDVTVGIANSETGTAVYTETHAVHSNANGLISLLIGNGTPVAGSNWDAIQWNHAWVTAVVSQGGTELATHHLPLSAVPYALYADQVDPVALANYLTANHYLTEEVQVLSVSNDTLYLTGGSWVKLPQGFSGDYNDLTNLPDLTQYATNVHLNDTLQNYLTISGLCDSIENCDVITNLQTADSLLGDRITRDSMALSDKIHSDSTYLKDLIDANTATITNNTTNITNNTTNISNITNNITNLQVSDSVLNARFTHDSIALANRLDTMLTHICDSIEQCAVITDLQNTDSLLGARITADSIRFNRVDSVLSARIINDSILFHRADSVLSARITADSTNLANNYYNKIKINDTVAYILSQMASATGNLNDNYYTKGEINDTLSHYTTTDRIDTLLGSYATKDTLAYYLTIDGLCDSIKNCEVITNLQTADSLLGVRITQDSILSYKADSLLGARITADSIKFNKADSVLAARIINDSVLFYKTDSVLLARILSDSVLSHQVDSMLLARIQNDSTNLAHNYYTRAKINDTLSHYTTSDQIDTLLGNYTTKDTLQYYLTIDGLCDSIQNCDVITNLQTADSLLGVRITQDSILSYRADSVLSARITADSANLAKNYYNKLKINDTVTYILSQMTSTSGNLNDNYYTKTEINDTLKHYLTIDGLCDSIQNCDIITNLQAVDSALSARIISDSVLFYHTDSVLLARILSDSVLSHQVDSMLLARIQNDSTNLAHNYYTKEKINDTLSHYTTSDQIDTLLGNYTTKDTLQYYLTIDGLCDSIQNCDVITNLQKADSLLGVRIETDSVLFHKSDSILSARIASDSLLSHKADSVLSARIKADSTNLATNYYNATTIDNKLNNYLTKDGLCDSIQNCDIITNLHAADSVLLARINNDSISFYKADSILAKLIADNADSISTHRTNITNNTTNITNNTTNITNLFTSDSLLSVRIHNDSLALSKRMDTLLTHICDSIQNCDIITDLQKADSALSARIKADSVLFYKSDSVLSARITADSILSYKADSALSARIKADSILFYKADSVLSARITADSILSYRADSALSARIKADSTDLKDHYYTKDEIDTKLHDTTKYALRTALADTARDIRATLNTQVTQLQNNIDSTSQHVRKALRDTARNIRNDICDSATHCMERALANPNSAINNAVDSIAENIAGHAIHDTLVHNVQFTNKGDSLFLKRGGIVDTVKFPAAKMIQDSLEKYVLKTAVRDSITNNVNLTVKNDSLFLTHGNDIDTVSAGKMIHDSIASRVHDGKLAVITHGATKLDTIQKFTANQAGNDTLDLSRYAIIDTLHDYYATKAALAESVHKIDSLAGVTSRDSVRLKNHYYTKDEIDTKLHDTTKYALRTALADTARDIRATLNTQVAQLQNNIDSTSQHVRKALRDTARNIRNDICDSATHCMERALANPNSAINNAVDSIAENIAGHAIHDTLVHNVQFTNKGDSLFLKRGGIVDTVKFPAAKMIQDSLEKYVLKTAVRDSITNNVNLTVKNDSLFLTHGNDIDTVSAGKMIKDSIENRVHDGKLAVITYGATKLDTIQKFTANQAGNDTLDLSRYALMDTLHDYYATKAALADSMKKVDTRIKKDSLEVRGLYIEAAKTLDSLAHVTYRDSIKLKTNYYTRTQVDSTADKVRSEIGKGKLTIQYGTNPAVEFGANQDTNTTVSIPTPPDPTYGTLTIKKNNEPVGTFTANQDNSININVPTCDSLANCDLIISILARLDKLERQNDSLARELDKLKPALTVTASQDAVTVCSGSSQPVTYTATFHNCSSSDYTLSWKVNGTDSSNVTIPTFTFNAEAAGDYVVVCVATRSDNSSVTDTVTTHVEVDLNVPSFTVTANNLTVTLSDTMNIATIQWDTDSLPVAMSNDSTKHSYAVADTITITATSSTGCTFTMGLRLQATAPTVTTDSIPTGTVAASTAKAYGTVTSDGGIPETKRGMVYSTSDQNLELGANGVDTAMNGTGKGSYSCNLKKLVPCTQYYVRAFAFNEVDTVYGEVLGFTTSSFTCGSTLTDIDGNEYSTLQLGSQCWMKQNLRTAHYADGTEIPLSNSTVATTSPRRYEPDSNLTTYGYLYNWYAAMGSGSSSSANPSGVQGVCPDGWHLPSDAEWTQLTSFVASNSANVCDNNPEYIVKALASKEGWGVCSDGGCNVCSNPSTNNNTQFSILPAGTWNNGSGDFGPHLGYDGGHTIFNSATGYDANHAWTRQIYTEYLEFRRDGYDKTIGLSVRCVLNKCATDPAYLPTVSAVRLTSTGGTKVSVEANVVSDGGADVTARGVCWSTSQDCSIENDTTLNGNGLGSFEASLTNLTPGITYHVRAYATNSEGTAYGAELIYVTPNRPTVTTTAATNVTANTATTGGEVTNDGGTEVTARGVCWSTSHNPTVENDTTLNGAGMGSFEAYLTNLTPSTTYYVRAYAINVIDTVYGEEITVATQNWSLNIMSDKAATIKMCGASSQTVTYTATPSYGDAGDYMYTWECSNGTTITDTTSNIAAFEYTAADTFTVTCTATHNDPENFVISRTTSTIVVNDGETIYLGMCNEGLTITSVDTINAKNYRFAWVSSISWGDSTSNTISSESFSHTYASPGIYTVTTTSTSGCDVTRTFVMGDIVTNPCMVAVAHTNTSTYTPSTGGLETTNSEGKITTVADNDGHTYKVAQIGSQCWMAENLRARINPDGSPISLESSSVTSESAAYRYNPVGGVSVESYGYFYNWTAVMNGASSSNTNPSGVRGICPLGWHVPSSAEWDQMLDVTGTDSSARLATGCDWKVDFNITYNAKPKWTPSDYSNVERNAFGFGALPAGDILNEDNFSIRACFWTSNFNDGYADYYLIPYNYYVQKFNAPKDNGFSLRCVRDGGIAEPITVMTDGASDIELDSATLNGSISNPSNVSISEKGFEWKPIAGDSYTTVTVNGATLSYNLTGLTPNTSYTFRAFATTLDGIVYGNEQSFTTKAEQFAVTTAPATNISQTSATLNGSVANPDPDNITISAQGFEWKKTTDDSYDSVHVSGTMLSYNLTGLTQNTSYTFRTFAIVDKGSETDTVYYGSVESFITPSLSLSASPSDDTLSICSGSEATVTYTATFANVNSDDYTISWKVNGTDSSAVTGLQLTVNVETAGDYKVACVATREDYSTLMDTIATYVNTITPSFTVTTDQLTVNLSDIANTATIKWDANSEAVPVSGTSATHDYSNWGTYNITATSAEGCTATKDVTLSVKKYCSNVEPRSNETAFMDGIDSLVDVQNHHYAVVRIGNQCWMAQNLRSTVYVSGSETVTIQNGFTGTSNSAFLCNPNDRDILVYGYLYNWAAATGMANLPGEDENATTRGVCPLGWHLPSKNDFEEMLDSIDARQHAGKLAGASPVETWDGTPNQSAPNDLNYEDRNSSGFSAVRSGYYDYFAPQFDREPFYPYGAFFWTCYNDGDFSTYLYMYNDNPSCGLDYNYNDLFMSVRCVRDEESGGGSTPSTPTLSVTSDPTAPTVCGSSTATVIYTASITDGEMSDYNYTWSSNPSGTVGANGYTYTVTYTEANTYTVTCTATPTGSGDALSASTQTTVLVDPNCGGGSPTCNLVNLGSISANYEAQDCDTLTGKLAGNYRISIAPNATVILRNVTINGFTDENATFPWAGITCEGDATIVLQGKDTVKGFYEDYPGLYIAPNKTLTIKGTGTLNASSNGWGAGIGGGTGINCGNILIEGGNITATGGQQAAGIGSGALASCGSISIQGGKIMATGGDYAAGVGTGIGASCVNITINGDTVIAKGGIKAAGIGTGDGQGAPNVCGDIIINGGYVKATSADNGAGIGTGRSYDQTNTCGSIIINGGDTVIANGGHSGAGIGTGCTYMTFNATNTCGNISINNGKVKAIAGQFATGIGTGRGWIATNTCGDISISGGKVYAKGNQGSAGIGAGLSYYACVCGNIIITGGEVTAEAIQMAAGIGSGIATDRLYQNDDYNGKPRSECGNIIITGGTVEAKGGINNSNFENINFKGGAGIGTGSGVTRYGDQLRSTCGSITIGNGVTSVTATKGSADVEYSIGKSHSSNPGTCGTVTIEDPTKVTQN